uniref:thylakoid lumenal 17.9 kDa protein, chloroplastic n=1 Tax=Erigeron canadensis TaxID=72917 RepID=UPI001CB89C60|nr:thylakoid lumenal 17.9 kDa protein, chloroplastic [Erigeron canadensis]
MSFFYSLTSGSTSHLLPPFQLITTTKNKNSPIILNKSPTLSSQNHNNNANLKISPSSLLLLSRKNLLNLAIAFVTLTSSSPIIIPSSLAIPSINSNNNNNKSAAIPPQISTTPFSQSKNLITGLDNGKIRPCPSNNPGCVSSNPQSSSFAFPWRIPDNALDNAIQQLQQAILETQKNAEIEVVEDTPDGKYLQATVDGGFGRDVMEFMLKGDVVSYRCMATKVTYVYPFTTALGDSKGQEERIRKVVDQLGWDAPSFSAMD